MICSCCGLEIKGKKRGPYNGDQYVCERCWNNPTLFFPDKPVQKLQDYLSSNTTSLIQDVNILETIDQYRQHSCNPQKEISETWEKILGYAEIKIPVIAINQSGMRLFLGKIKAFELLIIASVDQWTESECKGYQRVRYKSRNREIKEYLKKCPIPLIPSMLGSISRGTYTPINDCYGNLEIPLIPGSISILDGQQRTGGFDELFEEFKAYLRKDESIFNQEVLKKYNDLMNFEIPILMIDSAEIAKILSKDKEKYKNLMPVDIERAFFIIINKTQRGVNASLKDELASKTIEAGLSGIPVIEKDYWRAEIVPIANELNQDGEPLDGLINLGGIPGLKRPIQLNGFVTSLKELFVNNEDFRSLDGENKKIYLKNYWNAIKTLFPPAFDKLDYNNYLLTKSMGIYSLNYLSSDVYNHFVKNNIYLPSQEMLASYLSPIEDFDWNINSSPFADFGGKKGVKKAYNILLKHINSKTKIQK